MRTHRPVLITLGALLALVGLGCLGVGLGLTWAHATQRDADGFYTSPSTTLSTGGHAITSDDVTLSVRPGDWLPDPGQLTVRVEVRATEGERAVFVGLADSDDVRGYLTDVAHSQVTRVGETVDDVTYRTVSGTAVPAPPGTLDLWAATAAGTGTQVLTVDAAPGDWTLVVMNADGSAGVTVAASAGVASTLLLPIGVGLLIAAGVVLVAATALLVAGAGGPRSDPADGTDTTPERSAGPGTYPVRLTGRLDPDLSRGLWLVKWLLVLPHVVVLAFLWVAFALLTVAAGVAILVTGSYPRPIFEFNVGVLRWTWRVTYYAFGVLGTDRYPPFSLWADPEYPATLDVDHPTELARGLVLVKWWLLAIPHYLVVGVFTGGLVAWTVDVGATGGARSVASAGLVGVLVLIAAITLGVRGRYPRGLYDLIMGLQRWVYRVTAYVALMTDEYPPFRLDTGGDEPPATTDGPDHPARPTEGGRRDELLDA